MDFADDLFFLYNFSFSRSKPKIKTDFLTEPSPVKFQYTYTQYLFPKSNIRFQQCIDILDDTTCTCI